jgi:signal transduction histidine kinase
MALENFTKKQKWKLFLFIAAILIGFGSLWYTNILVKELKTEERKKIELWAEAMKQFETASLDQDISFILKTLQNNKTVPVILTDEADNIIHTLNLDSEQLLDSSYLKEQLEQMKELYPPIEINVVDGVNHVYYRDSTLLTKLTYYPFIQLLVIFLFIVVAYFAFSSSRRAEQNQVWVGMSKETAHQLGTPISSLLAWIELLKMKNEDDNLVQEVEKDIKRLETITERFSKIGSAPVLTSINIVPVLYNSVSYVKNRSSNKVKFNMQFLIDEVIPVPLNIALFEWVIENLCKNAIDAMNGSGFIDVSITDQIQVIFIDIKDSGKGIPKSKYKTVFQPGYTTKKRGWGLGLSLSKRIIEEYHSGKIFVKSSEPNNGTTFRIVLKK